MSNTVNPSSCLRIFLKTLSSLPGVNRAFTIVFLVSQLLVFAAGCDSPPDTKFIDFEKVAKKNESPARTADDNEKSYIFGFDFRTSLKEDVKQYAPFVHYLTNKTGYNFKLRITPTGSHISDELGMGIIHFAAIGAGSFIKAQAQYGITPLVRGLNSQGKAEYRSHIIVAPNSPIRTVADIRNKRFAFGNITSTQGHLIPRIVLGKHGINLNDFTDYKFTGSHYKCANAVISGKFDAGGIQDTLGFELENDGLIRIIHSSKYYPSSGIATNRDVPSEVIIKVKKALLAFEPKGRHAHLLYNWHKTEMPNGFIEAVEEDYAELGLWAKKMGLLDSL